MEPQFDSLDGRSGVEIRDPIEKVRFELHTPSAVEPTPATAESFYYPVDSAVTVETDEIVFPILGSIYVYSADGEFLQDFTPNSDTELTIEPGEKYYQLNGTPIVIYLSFSSAVTIRKSETEIRLSFDGSTAVRIGARSYHESPEGTITVTGSVRDTMRALSTFGSALKMTTPDRAHPTLRGHPPLVELGDEFHVPESIDPPDTGVRLELPLLHEKVYPAASLAYYLGAEVVPTSGVPKLVAGDFEYSLESDGTYEGILHRLLRQTAFLDCLVRTEGIVKDELYERNQLEPRLDWDFADVYDSSLPEQLETYLSVPFETISEYVPTWTLTTDVTPLEKHAAVLPFLAYDLSQIRSAPLRSSKQSISQPQMFDDFYRTGFTRGEKREFESPDLLRGASERTDAGKIVRPDPVETTEHAWIGDGFPLGANKLTVETLKRRFDYSAPNKSGISIHVVCNDGEMSDEIVDELYGFRELVDYDITIDYNRTVAELREIIESPIDLFHYVGHVDENGFLCVDGSLDAQTLEDVGIKAFFLNACSSYEQGMALIGRGSMGGVVTLADVANKTATRVGRTFASLLNNGFQLRTALSIARKETVSGYRYITLGNGGRPLMQPEGGVPSWTSVSDMGGEKYDVSVETFLDIRCGFGSTFTMNVLGTSARNLVSNGIEFEKVSTDKLKQFWKLERQPAVIGGQVCWNPIRHLN
ncbi:hypothetical protein ZOD2009_18759 [Haladaptatus paucihalophilus DX253]|uniref:Uncharacterized protein n=1 Tax=Haladaptatus paucihalophilus DX253 TaxID=797209 RepID=E7QY62_HALPU|nr:hypothetical protein [Haladaptatus paucihalophilus]EFW90528.1 hypothetical protein ZOD2009_18759 [Haladaptatus paucihalophilus DX253]SHK77484.1 hypothetical protein SAMN05444342_2139 [Haladaptatus paucihalophilus DX253]